MFASSSPQAGADFGVVAHGPRGRFGYCAPEDVQALVDKCGCETEGGEPMKVSSLPFQGHAKVDGERWILRIEPIGTWAVNGSLRASHQWSFAKAAGGDDQYR